MLASKTAAVDAAEVRQLWVVHPSQAVADTPPVLITFLPLCERRPNERLIALSIFRVRVPLEIRRIHGKRTQWVFGWVLKCLVYERYCSILPWTYALLLPSLRRLRRLSPCGWMRIQQHFKVIRMKGYFIKLDVGGVRSGRTPLRFRNNPSSKNSSLVLGCLITNIPIKPVPKIAGNCRPSVKLICISGMAIPANASRRILARTEIPPSCSGP